MSKDKNNVIANIDLTIIEICKWLQKGLANSELYPVDGINALAELITARAKISYLDSSDNEWIALYTEFINSGNLMVLIGGEPGFWLDHAFKYAMIISIVYYLSVFAIWKPPIYFMRLLYHEEFVVTTENEM